MNYICYNYFYQLWTDGWKCELIDIDSNQNTKFTHERTNTFRPSINNILSCLDNYLGSTATKNYKKQTQWERGTTFSKQVDIANTTEKNKRKKKIQKNYKNQTQKQLHEGILSRRKEYTGTTNFH